MSKAYGIGGYKAALASFRFRGVFDTDSASLSIVERISEVLPVATFQTEIDGEQRGRRSGPVTRPLLIISMHDPIRIPRKSLQIQKNINLFLRKKKKKHFIAFRSRKIDY